MYSNKTIKHLLYGIVTITSVNNHAIRFTHHHLSRETVLNALCLALGLTGVYGIAKTIQSSLEPKRKDREEPTNKKVIISASITCLAASLLALSFRPSWAR